MAQQTAVEWLLSELQEKNIFKKRIKNKHMNEYDVKRLALVLALQAEVEGMKAENKLRVFDQQYTMEDFENKAEEFRNLAHAHNEQLFS